jgi:hypothetical protein
VKRKIQEWGQAEEEEREDITRRIKLKKEDQ